MFGYELSAWGYLLLYVSGHCFDWIKKGLFYVGQAEARLLKAFWLTLIELWNVLKGFCQEDEFPDACM